MATKKTTKRKRSTARLGGVAAVPSAASRAQERKWQAEQDARTLAEAKVIAADRRRVNAACAAAKKMAGEKMKEAKAMQGVSKRGKA